MVIIRRVVGRSMEPRLKPGQLVVGLKLRRLATPGSIIIFNHQAREKIKRLGHVKGEAIFVAGDNRLASTDSRDFGWLPKDAILARVIWPWR